MRCPKCGAFLDEGRETCFMCGGKIDSSISSFSQNETINNFEDAQTNFEIKSHKDEQSDSIQNKGSVFKRISMIIIAVVVSFVIIIVINFFKSHDDEIVKKPVFGNLYFQVDESFELNIKESDKLFYLKDNNLENECSMEVVKARNSDDNHESVYFDSIRIMLEEDSINNLTTYQTKDGKINVNGVLWFYFNVLYDSGENINFLKTRYLTTVRDGIYYDVKLTNVKNDSQCALQLDQFVESFEFVE